MEKKWRFVFLFLCFCILLLFPSSGGTHSGGLDANGGHYNRKTGEYHYHRGATVTPPAPRIAPQTPGDRGTTSGVQPRESISFTATEKEKRINDYFRSANENVGALDCGLVIHARDVSDATKNIIKSSYRNECIICKSKVKLEVDHQRALMNGGTNDISNLTLLCDDCHTIKTKYDNSLRRKRDSICRKK